MLSFHVKDFEEGASTVRLVQGPDVGYDEQIKLNALTPYPDLLKSPYPPLLPVARVVSSLRNSCWLVLIFLLLLLPFFI